MTDELNYTERKEWARLLYTRHDQSAEDTALQTGADADTVRAWASEGGWDGIKRSLLISRTNHLETLYTLLEQVYTRLRQSEEMNPKDVDLLLKYSGVISNLEPGTNVCSVVEVADLFVNWLRRRDLALTQKITPQLDAFIRHRLAA